MSARAVKRSRAEIGLAAALVAYIVCDVLLTPPAHLETRDPALVTAFGIATLVLLFIGLALSVVALVLIYRRWSRAPTVAIVAAIPAPLTELTGHFSSLRAPAAIAALEVLQAIVAVIVIVVGLQALRMEPKQSG